MSDPGDVRIQQSEDNRIKDPAGGDGLPTETELATLQRVPAEIPWRGK